MAGVFSRRVKAFCAKNAVPLIEARAGERKHQLAEPYLPADPKFRGLFLIITGNAAAPVWEVLATLKARSRKCGIARFGRMSNTTISISSMRIGDI
jgi:hypothetical protein